MEYQSPANYLIIVVSKYSNSNNTDQSVVISISRGRKRRDVYDNSPPIARPTKIYSGTIARDY